MDAYETAQIVRLLQEILAELKRSNDLAVEAARALVGGAQKVPFPYKPIPE